MAGKKKKSLANKLAKMSDEERARYLQHRAEMEEEAKRRKEQLIAIFMKKKIKKEEAFARLNLAKINQNWHQIMRTIKVKEMKSDVEYLKAWIERLVENKNNRIAKLMEELEDAEEQYMNNFNSHSRHLDEIIGAASKEKHQNGHIEKLQSDYREELDGLIEQAKAEENLIQDHSNAEVLYLKTVAYGQATVSEKLLKESWEAYSKRLYEVEYNVS
ncbi:hypothetical protein HUJ04_007982 [Dendroctonus ponderosae]|nr:hypothetical protein HUJ04_007982 [Dendroctonus ponderosae]